MTLDTFCRKVQDHYGWDVERDKVFEELSEFQAELSRQPHGRSSHDKLLEEAVDLEICLHHVLYHFGYSQREIVNMMQNKMQRTLDEIQREKDRLETPLGKIGERREKA